MQKPEMQECPTHTGWLSENHRQVLLLLFPIRLDPKNCKMHEAMPVDQSLKSDSVSTADVDEGSIRLRLGLIWQRVMPYKSMQHD